jgi:hypothetical protein
MIETARLRELAASYRSEVKAPSATAALARYREEFAQYLESVADALDSAQIDTRTALRSPNSHTYFKSPAVHSQRLITE